jgi:uncharacterized membrane protein
MRLALFPPIVIRDMCRLKTLAIFTAVSALALGCSIFDDPRPERVSFRMSGSSGATVTAIYSKQFVAAVNELGITEVEVFGADTVVHLLPIDTIVDVVLEQRFFVQVEAMPSDTLSVQVRVDIDGRNVLNDSGGILGDAPWRYLYQYNQTFTRVYDVVF